ncbi:MAG: hypothetical protein QNK92_04455 [Amylibacter sp.]
MKLFFILSTVLLLTTGVANAVEWKASCNSKYSYFKGTYTFKVKQGKVGGCPDDSKKHFTGGWKFSERSEVKGKKLGYGKYEWSATVTIERYCKPSYRSTIVQVHSGTNTAQRPMGPPSFLAENYEGKFRGIRNKGTLVGVPINEPFDVFMTVNFTKDYVNTVYYINGEHVLTEKDKYKIPKKIYFKFGVYRVKSNCDAKQLYTNVKLKKVK